MPPPLTATDLIAVTGTALLTAEQAAKLLNYPSANALREQVRQGKLRLPRVKRGHKYLYPVTAIVDLVNSANREQGDRLSRLDDVQPAGQSSDGDSSGLDLNRIARQH
jgi:hypothetical protein